jgi:biopolymer transport protein ExbB
MAGGISSALITTVLGIVSAIPLILAHAFVSSKSKSLIHMLEEQSAGLVAQHVEGK